MIEPLSDQPMAIFCNGLNNSLDDARRGAKALSLAMGTWVECYYNDSLGGTLWHREKKRSCAKALAEKVRDYLQRGPNLEAVLILHSHGRDIGWLALQRLSVEEKKRITVVTLGSSPIASNAAKKVINLRLQKDPIPFVMEVRDHMKKIVHFDFSVDKTEKIEVDGRGHFLATYLEKPEIQKTLFQINRKIFKMQSSC